MFDTETRALLRALLEEVCLKVSRHEGGIRAHVASKLLEAAARGERAPGNLKATGRAALQDALAR